MYTHKIKNSIDYIRNTKLKIFKTVLVQDHFYSDFLLFALANKTITQSRMIMQTCLFVKEIPRTGFKMHSRLVTLLLTRTFQCLIKPDLVSSDGL